MDWKGSEQATVALPAGVTGEGCPPAGGKAARGVRPGLNVATASMLLLTAWAVMHWSLLSGSRVLPWDAMFQFYVYFRFLSESWHSGQSAFWNPSQYAGMPAIADPQSLLWHPVMAGLAWLAPQPGPALFAAGQLGQLLAGGFATLLYFRLRGWRPEGGLLAALIFTFGGVASSRLQHSGLIMSYALLPVAFLALAWSMQRPGPGRGLLAGLMLGWLLLGRDQVAFLGCLVLGAAALTALIGMRRERAALRRAAATVCVSGLVALAVAAVPTLLTLELLQLSNRPAIGYWKAAAGSLSPVNFFTLVMPNYFRGFDADGMAWGPGNIAWSTYDLTDRSTNYLFIGAVPLVLLFWHGLLGRRLFAREARFFLVLLLVATAYAVGRFTPLFRLAYDWLPFVNVFRRPADAAFIVNFAVAILAGWLLHRLAEAGEPAADRRRCLWTGVVLAGGMMALGLGIAASQGQGAHVARASGVALASITCATLVIGWAKAPRWRPLAILAMLALAVGELWLRNAGTVLNARDPGEYRALIAPEMDPLVQALRHKVEGAVDAAGSAPRVEVLGLGGAWQNAPVTAGLEGTLGYNPLQIERYAAAVGARQNAHLAKRHFTPLFPSYDSAMARLLGLRFVASAAPIASLDKHLAGGLLPPAEAVGASLIQELPPQAPRAFLAPAIMVVESGRILRTGRWPVADPITTPLVERLPAEWPSLARSRDPSIPAAALRIREQTNARIRLDVATPSRALLVLNDPWYPGWVVRVDGVAHELVRTNLVFRGVALAAGRHEVEFSFEPLAPGNLWRALQTVLAGPVEG